MLVAAQDEAQLEPTRLALHVPHARSGHEAARNVAGDFDVDSDTELVRDHAFDPLRAGPRNDRPWMSGAEVVVEQDDAGAEELRSLRVADVTRVPGHAWTVALVARETAATH